MHGCVGNAIINIMSSHPCSSLDTQVFMVDLRANKKMIKAAVNELYEIQCKKINTLIRCVFTMLCV